jgi:hypothetical protein
MNITHIVTAGCSFTYCQNLEIDKSWPALLARNLNCPLVNLALPGQGNDSIHRRLYEYLYNNDFKYKNSKPFVIIVWSSPQRKERWRVNHYSIQNFNDFAPVYYTRNVLRPLNKTDNEPDSIEEEILENYSEEENHRNTLLNKASVVSLLKLLDIPFLMTDAMSQEYQSVDYAEVKSRFYGLDNVYKIKNYIDPLVEVTKKFKSDFLPCGHYGPHTCMFLQNFIKTKMNEIYPNLSFVNDHEYLSFYDYAKNDAYVKRWPDWLNFKL